jgi:hypothetical protein
MPPRPPVHRSTEGVGAGAGVTSSVWPAVITAVLAALVGAALQKHLAVLSTTEVEHTDAPPTHTGTSTIKSSSSAEPPSWSDTIFPELPAVAQPIQLARDLGYMNAAETAEVESQVDVSKEMVSSHVQLGPCQACN